MGRAEVLELLESLRLPEEPIKNKDVLVENVKEKNVAEDDSSNLSNPKFYGTNIPFLLYDENKETIISRTAQGINESKLNPYEVNWMEVTLYETSFIREVLEHIDTAFLKDVAQAIDDEDTRHGREDGQYTNIASSFYGTGQGNANFYSYMRDNWSNNNEYVSATSIAEGLLDKRNKAEAYKKKMKLQKENSDKKNAQNEIIPSGWIIEGSSINELTSKLNQLIMERDEWKEKYERDVEAIKKEPEKAFNAQTNKPCFTSKQMCIFLRAIAKLTEQSNPPAKTTLGVIVERIAGYAETTATSNLKQQPTDKDKDAVASALESKFPHLAAIVRKL